MAELLGRRPLLPGKDYVDQLKLIIKTLGPPLEDDLTFISSHKARAYIRALPPAEVRATCTCTYSSWEIAKRGLQGTIDHPRAAACGGACHYICRECYGAVGTTALSYCLRMGSRLCEDHPGCDKQCPAPPPVQKVDFQKKFPDADPMAIDLMEKMLQFDPRKRCTVVEALKHPWLAQLHDEAAEPFAPGG